MDSRETIKKRVYKILERCEDEDGIDIEKFTEMITGYIYLCQEEWVEENYRMRKNIDDMLNNNKK